MDLSLPTVCIWIPYLLDSTIPRNATLGGYFNEGDQQTSYHFYVVRTWDAGELVAVRQTHSQHHWAIHFKRGSNEFIRATRLSSKMGEILTCNNDIVDLRWITFNSSMKMDTCIPYGTLSLGETGYIGRTFVRKPTDDRVYGLVPGLFIPSDGFLTVYLGGLYHSSNVEVLCAN